MIPASLTTKLKKQITLYEGNVSHMYLDSKGYVTIGIGSLIPSLKAAQKLPFVHSKTHKNANASEIKTEFQNIKKLKPNEHSTYYKKHTKLILSQINITKLFNLQVKTFHGELLRLYINFKSYPIEVKLALFDMIYNLGLTRLKREFPKFNSAIKQKDWLTAAKESHRKPPVKSQRNNYVKRLFLRAANNNRKMVTP